MTQEMYFHRQIQLWGTEAQEKLAVKKIAIVGAGGLGCSIAIALGSSGIGTIDIIDFDKVAFHNIHRQIAFTLEDEGKNKADVIATLLKKKNPFLSVNAYNTNFKVFKELNNHYDLILDATDNLEVRKEIDFYAKEKSIPWIYASVEAFNGQVCLFAESSFQVFNMGEHTPEGIAAPMVMHIASLQSNLALRYLVGLPILKDKLYYLYFNQEGELITQKFGMPKVES